MTQSYESLSGDHTNHQFPRRAYYVYERFHFASLTLEQITFKILDQEKNVVLPPSEPRPQSCLPFPS